MKRLAAMAIIILSLFLSVNCLAAPASIDAGDAGISGLVIVKRPETAISSTTKRIYTVSAVSNEGTEISIYAYNPYTGLFDILKDSGGNAVSSYVGASGLYARDIELSENTNYLALRAEYGSGLVQVIRFDITLLNQELLDSINGFSKNFESVFGKTW